MVLLVEKWEGGRQKEETMLLLLKSQAPFQSKTPVCSLGASLCFFATQRSWRDVSTPSTPILFVSPGSSDPHEMVAAVLLDLKLGFPASGKETVLELDIAVIEQPPRDYTDCLWSLTAALLV